MNFKDIPQFPRAGYEITVGWDYLERYLEKERAVIDEDGTKRKDHLILEPDYQRGHVWNNEQRAAFVEYGLMGGEMGMNITTNCPGWMGDFRGPYELVDGLQRVTAVQMFMHDKIKAFGHYFSEFEGRIMLHKVHFNWRVLSLPTRKEVLRLYLLLNSGGVVHSPEEIARVKELLAKEGT